MSARLEPQIEILPMNEHDLDALMQIETDVYPFPWTRGNFADSLRTGYSCWVCRVAGELVGYAVIMFAVDDAHLLNITVARARHGKGYGARLLAQAITVARRAHARILLLEVRPSNARAIALYRSFGFRQIGVRRGYYPTENGREDALVLTRTLTEVSA
ncbi:ribosomal protein S18-alanine N-acetyltransferase [Rhodocyclus tenuis]|uniref:[Ribosomal protein bS18]-alanine N-acetyltransferase n=2 Tax=Rhodocyclus TaxID=1064 RepID=A0A6L5JYG1_RHOTE|nr:ribosomal protein S18-alanine N-acetyltransferase [Rhodocyclus gracilis]MQY51238.1 ribosomal-protein-alanine N-acetyltransferase [Rhodocyclus gracilis]NJA89921.1 ribosomal protein S18-alanine N-acetyltransferase [Rhodocyclus gracilis]